MSNDLQEKINILEKKILHLDGVCETLIKKYVHVLEDIHVLQANVKFIFKILHKTNPITIMENNNNKEINKGLTYEI